MRKIDVFTHIWPKPFHEALIAHLGHTTDITRRSEAVPMMTDLDRRFEVMDLFGPEYCQILSLASPPYEKYANPAKSLELATIASDGMAELCHRYPDRFPGFIGTAVMSNPAAMVEDARRNIEDLGAVSSNMIDKLRLRTESNVKDVISSVEDKEFKQYYPLHIRELVIEHINSSNVLSDEQ